MAQLFSCAETHDVALGLKVYWGGGQEGGGCPRARWWRMRVIQPTSSLRADPSKSPRALPACASWPWPYRAWVWAALLNRQLLLLLRRRPRWRFRQQPRNRGKSRWLPSGAANRRSVANLQIDKHSEVHGEAGTGA